MATKTATPKQKLAFAKKVLKAGTNAPGEIQKALKKEFGSGLPFWQLGEIYPSKNGKKTTTKRGPGRPKGSKTKKRGPGRPPKARRGRPPASSRDALALLVADEFEFFSGPRQLEARVGELLAEGHAPSELVVYERSPMKLSVRTTVSL